MQKRELQMKETGKQCNIATASTTALPSEGSTDEEDDGDYMKEKHSTENEAGVKKRRMKITDLLTRAKPSPSGKKRRVCPTKVRTEHVKDEKKSYTTKKMIMLPVYIVDEKEELINE